MSNQLRDKLAEQEGAPYTETGPARVMAFKNGWDAAMENANHYENAALRLSASTFKELQEANKRILLLENLLNEYMTKIEDLSLHYRFGMLMKETNKVLSNDAADFLKCTPDLCAKRTSGGCDLGKCLLD